MFPTEGLIYAKNMAFYVLIGCVRFARYCGKMYSRHLFPYGRLSFQSFKCPTTRGRSSSKPVSVCKYLQIEEHVHEHNFCEIALITDNSMCTT